MNVYRPGKAGGGASLSVKARNEAAAIWRCQLIGARHGVAISWWYTRTKQAIYGFKSSISVVTIIQDDKILVPALNQRLEITQLRLDFKRDSWAAIPAEWTNGFLVFNRDIVYSTLLAYSRKHCHPRVTLLWSLETYNTPVHFQTLTKTRKKARVKATLVRVRAL